MAERSERFEFPGGQGDRLSGRLDHPVGAPVAVALFAHCFTCSKDTLAAARISTALAEQGIAVLRFDFTGLGGSEGAFANTNFSSNVDDLVSAAEYLRAHYEAPQILVGHSLGGAAMLRAAARVPDAAAVATIGAPCDPEHGTRQLAAKRAGIEARGEAEIELGGRTFSIPRQFLDDIAMQPMQASIGRLRKALLVMHSPLDEVVGIDHASRIFAAAKHPKSFVSLDRADHLLSRRADSAYVAQVLAAWASRYLAGEQGTLEQGPSEAGERGVVVVAAGGAGFTASGPSAFRLVWVSPIALSGAGLGPGLAGLRMIMVFSKSAAVAAAEEEVAFAQSLCTQPQDTLIAVHRLYEDGDVRETFRTLRPRNGPKPARAFSFLEVEGEDEEESGEQVEFVARGE